VLIEAGFKVFDTVVTVDRAFCLLPPYKVVRDLVLDTILGPAEAIEYVSQTAPSSPPPNIS
jgi:hypothetical protein